MKINMNILCLGDIHRGGVMKLIIGRIILLWIALFLFSVAVFAEVDSPSFYGKRTIGPVENNNEKAPLSFQRRSLVLTPLEDNKQNEEPQFLMVEKGNQSIQPVINAKTELSRNEKLLAKKAHYYFERNWNPSTGFTDSVQGYHHVTMWDVASDISAQFSLEGLGLQSKEITNKKLEQLLTTLSVMPLYNNQLPNREYNTKTGMPSGLYSSHKSNGNGWSALDIGRLLIWLYIIEQEKPEFSSLIEKITTTWVLSSAVSKQTLYGTKLSKKGEHYRQEGRLGYLQYASFGFLLFGFDVSESYQKKHIEQVSIEGISFLIDTRNMPFSTSDPYILMRLEVGNFQQWWDQLNTIYLLHKAKEERTKKHWVFGEDSMNKSPWFAYNNLFFYGKSWLSTSSGGKPIEVFQVFSNKVAFGFSVLFNDEYALNLRRDVINNSLYSRVIPTGIYSDSSVNTAYNINTNSMILSSLWYKVNNNSPVIKRDAMLKVMQGQLKH